MKGKKRNKKLNLAIFYNVPIFYDERIGYSGDYINEIDFFLSISKNISKLSLFLPVGFHRQGSVKFIVPSNVDIVALPYYGDEAELLKNVYRVVSKLISLSFSQYIKDCDIVGIVGPGTMSFVVSPIVYFFQRKPIIYFIRGDKQKTISYEFKQGSFKKFIEVSVLFYDFSLQWFLKRRNTLAFTFGKDLQHKYRNLVSTENIFNLTPMISENIIYKSQEIPEVKNVLYVGRLSKAKGLYDLLTAFAKIIKSSKRNLVLHIAGSGREETNLRQEAENLGISHLTRFHGFIPNGDKLWSLYSQCQLFILPSYTEGTPRVLFEAMARGVAVITTNVGGIPYIVKDEINGLVIEPGNIKALADAMLKLIDDKELRKRVIEEGRKNAFEVTFEKQGKRMIEIIENNLLMQEEISHKDWG